MDGVEEFSQRIYITLYRLPYFDLISKLQSMVNIQFSSLTFSSSNSILSIKTHMLCVAFSGSSLRSFCRAIICRVLHLPFLLRHKSRKFTRCPCNINVNVFLGISKTNAAVFQCMFYKNQTTTNKSSVKAILSR